MSKWLQFNGVKKISCSHGMVISGWLGPAVLKDMSVLVQNLHTGL